MSPIRGVFTVAEAATAKKVSTSAVYLAIKEGRLKAPRSGKTYLIRQKDLDAWQPIGHRPRKNKEEP